MKQITLLLTLLCAATLTQAQVGIGTTIPAASSILDVTSTTKGLLAPRMTTAQRDNITSPATGLQIYNTDNGALETFTGTTSDWFTIGNGKSGISFNTAVGVQALYSNTSGNYNTASGRRALYSNTSGRSNTAHGFNALYGNQTGQQNTGNGGFCLQGNTTGSFNTAIGYAALISNTTGNYNTAVGVNTLKSNNIGIENTANGSHSLYSNTGGSWNTANGYKSLYSNTTGSNNVANGQQALKANTTGDGNIAVGALALGLNTDGDDNIAHGTQTLYFNTTGSKNVAYGTNALLYNTTGAFNTALGNGAGNLNTTGTNNTLIGYDSDVASVGLTNATAIGNGASVASSNTIQLGNTSVTNVKTSGTITAGAFTIPNTDGTANQVLKTDGSGTLSWSLLTPPCMTTAQRDAIASPDTGLQIYNTDNGALETFTGTAGKWFTVGIGGGASYLNTAVGVDALLSNTTGNYNTANGLQALETNTTGDANTANGSYSLYLTTGSNNTATGRSALWRNNSGNENTATGMSALQTNTTGSNNTAIGYQADVGSSNLSNATAIGNGASVTGSNKVRIGNSSVTTITGQVAWTSVSDGRIKENVQEAVPGLSFIAELRPVTYTLNTRKQDVLTMQAMPDSIQAERMLSDADYLASSSIVRTGFIAQEVEAAAKKVGFDFDGVSTPQNETDLYGIRYAEFVVPLVKAMQEQQAMIAEQQKTIDELLERIEALEN